MGERERRRPSQVISPEAEVLDLVATKTSSASSWLSRAVDKPPTWLQELSTKHDGVILEESARLVRQAKIFNRLLFFEGLISILVLMALYVSVPFESYDRWVMLSAAVVFAGLMYQMLRWRQAHTIEARVVHRLLPALDLLILNPDKWREPIIASKLNRKLELLSRAYEDMPIAYRTRRPAVQETALRIAEGTRELQVWVSQPMASTHTDLVDVLEDSLVKFCKHEWYQIHQVDEMISKRLRLSVRVFLVVAVLAGVAGIVLTGVYGTEWGVAQTVLVVVCMLVITSALARLGISPSSLREAIDTSGQINSSTS